MNDDGLEPEPEPRNHVVREPIPPSLWDRIRNRQRYTTRRIRRWPCSDATALMRYGDSDNPQGYKLELTAVGIEQAAEE
jgi:hypothetical protein